MCRQCCDGGTIYGWAKSIGGGGGGGSCGGST